jgi:hypothetical protein
MKMESQRGKPRRVEAIAVSDQPENAKLEPVERSAPMMDMQAMLREIVALREKDLARDAQMAALQQTIAAAPGDTGKPKHPAGPWDFPETGLVIVARSGKDARDEAAIAAFDEHFDPLKSGVFVKMSTCGMSVLIDTPEKMPRYNMRCPCGRTNHWAIRYEIEK